MSKVESLLEKVKDMTHGSMDMYEVSRIELKKLYDEGRIDKKTYFRKLKEIAIATVKQRRRTDNMNIISQMIKIQGHEVPGRVKNPPLKVLESIARFEIETELETKK